MKIIENSKVKEKLYVEKLENGLTVMIIPKKGVQKKYVIWGTNYGCATPFGTSVSSVSPGTTNLLSLEP